MIVTNVLYNVKGVIDQEEGLHGWLLAKLLFVVPFLDVLWYLTHSLLEILPKNAFWS